MSSISGIGGSGFDLTKLLTALLAKRQEQTDEAEVADAAGAAADTTSADTSADATSTVAALQAELRQAIQAAAVASLRNFNAASGSPSDLLDVIQQTINQTLKAYGIDVDQMQNAFTPTSPSQTSSTDIKAQLDAMLEENGITTQQFKDTLLDMLEGNTQSSQTSATQTPDLSWVLSLLFRDVPSGTALDVEG